MRYLIGTCKRKLISLIRQLPLTTSLGIFRPIRAYFNIEPEIYLRNYSGAEAAEVTRIKVNLKIDIINSLVTKANLKINIINFFKSRVNFEIKIIKLLKIRTKLNFRIDTINFPRSKGNPQIDTINFLQTIVKTKPGPLITVNLTKLNPSVNLLFLKIDVCRRFYNNSRI